MDGRPARVSGSGPGRPLRRQHGGRLSVHAHPDRRGHHLDGAPAAAHRTQHGVVHALQRARGMFPFPLLGIDTDNGGEFINEELMAYCATEQLTFTRGRVANKNDQCYVEQKNGSVVRQLVGYDRFEGERAYRQLAELYRAVRLYVNFFQPSMKLRTKTRTGSRVRRMYD